MKNTAWTEASTEQNYNLEKIANYGLSRPGKHIEQHQQKTLHCAKMTKDKENILQPKSDASYQLL